MKVKDLLIESESSNEKLPQDKKAKLRNKLKDIWSVIEHFEKTGEIHKDDQAKVETFKDFIEEILKEKPRDF